MSKLTVEEVTQKIVESAVRFIAEIGSQPYDELLKVAPDTQLEKFGMDSLDKVEAVMAIEEDLEVDFTMVEDLFADANGTIKELAHKAASHPEIIAQFQNR